ncbi:FtsX-like permease family protein [Glycomyces sp. NPDC048151]|uniref:ABC transporter permease n=1 Tax=Glycomyces sp. NPDC048151 TaxID=3364002 RepID=UPI00371BAD55
MGRFLASQRLAFRIARREALRYKGRSALSITLLGLPLLGVAIGASAYDTTTLNEEETYDQYVGENDGYIEEAYPGEPLVQYTWREQYPWWEADWEEGKEPPGISEAEILNALPVGSRITPYGFWNGGEERAEVETPNGVGEIEVLGYDLTDPAYEAAGITYLDGGAPIRDEVALSEDAASYLGVGVGDSVTFVTGITTEEHEVSGIVEIPWGINDRYAVASFFPDSTMGWLVDTPEQITHEDALRLNESGLTVWAASLFDVPPSSPDDSYYSTSMDEFTLTIYALIIVTVVMEVVLLAGPAFAISAKRRTREFALMSANGATPSQIRGVVLAGGILFGILAALAAVILGVGLVAAGRPWLEQLVGYRTPGVQVLPWLQGVLVVAAICTGLLSALAAAVSASRVNVVAALMGRTLGRKSSRVWLIIGLAMVAGGLVAGFAGISIWNMPLMAAAIVMLQLGLVACTPALLSATAKLGRWMPLAPRMALREAGRNRGSAAPAIAAVLGVVAGGMAFTLTVAADNVRNEAAQERLLPQGTASLLLHNNAEYDPETGEPVGEPAWDAALAETETRLEKHLDDVDLVAVNLVGESETCGREGDFAAGAELYCFIQFSRPDENMCSYWETMPETEEEIAAAVEEARTDPRCDEQWDSYGYGMYDVPSTTDPAVVAAYTGLEGDELDAAVAVLEDGGVLVSDPWAVTDEGTVVFTQEVSEFVEEGPEPEPKRYEVAVPAMAVDKDLLGYAKVLFSPGAAEQVGMVPSEWSQRYLVETSTAIDGPLDEAVSADMRAELSDDSVFASFEVTDYNDPGTFYMMLAVAGLCALITLGSTAVSTGLIIAEQKKDMTTLGAVGAAPGLRKRFAMWQTTMIALFGTILGTFAGLIGYALIREALNRPLTNQYPYQTLYGWELPWASFAIMLVAVPVLAAVGALVFTKARLPSERRLT